MDCFFVIPDLFSKSVINLPVEAKSMFLSQIATTILGHVFFCCRTWLLHLNVTS